MLLFWSIVASALVAAWCALSGPCTGTLKPSQDPVVFIRSGSARQRLAISQDMAWADFIQRVQDRFSLSPREEVMITDEEGFEVKSLRELRDGDRLFLKPPLMKSEAVAAPWEAFVAAHENETLTAGLRLDLGGGSTKTEGWVNVDKHGSPDVKIDLERYPWPFPTNSTSHVRLNHVLEHVGQQSEVFIQFMQELYRISQSGAIIHIQVPHHLHDDYFSDPTHVRPITSMTLKLFDKENCRAWQEMKAANSPLALWYDVDFQLIDTNWFLDPEWEKSHPAEWPVGDLSRVSRHSVNIIKSGTFTLRVRK